MKTSRGFTLIELMIVVAIIAILAARALIAAQASADKPLVLVTHQVNITALSGVFPASGEIIVMRVEGDALSLAGRIRTAP